MCGITEALMMAGTAVSAVGQMQSARAAQQAANFQSQIEARNAEFATQRADDALLRGQEKEQQLRQDGGQQLGQQRARMGAAGLDLSHGSPLDVLIDTHMGIELDAARARRNAQLEADDFETQAWNHRAQAGMHRAEGRNARTAGMIGAAGTVLGGAGNVRQYRARVG